MSNSLSQTDCNHNVTHQFIVNSHNHSLNSQSTNTNLYTQQLERICKFYDDHIKSVHIAYQKQYTKLQSKYIDLESKYKQLQLKYQEIIPTQQITELNRLSPTLYYRKKVLNIMIILLFRRAEYCFNHWDLTKLFDEILFIKNGCGSLQKYITHIMTYLFT